MDIIYKKRIDTGIRNNPSTGDVLADGGDKLNFNADSLYNTFGDKRLYGVNHGIDRQFLHATGYWQKYPPIEYSKVVPMGSKHDIDTTTGSITLKLPKVKVGECVDIINSNGSISSRNPLIIQTEMNDSFSEGQNSITIRTPYVRIITWGVRDVNGFGTWDYSIQPLYEKEFSPVDINVFIKTTGTIFDIANINDFKVIKLLTYFHDSINNYSKSSEILLHMNNETKTVYHTEYAVIGNKPEDLLHLEFYLEGDMVKMRVQSKAGSNSRFIMKSIESI